MANVITNPNADQTISSHNLLPAVGNITQSLGSSPAPWNIYSNFQQSDSIIVLAGSGDPYGGLISAAISGLPAAGGIVDARAPGVAAVSQGAIDPGSIAVTILLGPYTYLLDHVVMRPNLRIYGAGWQGSKLQSTNAASHMFVVQQQAGGSFFGCVFDGLQFLGASGNTAQDCFHWDLSNRSIGPLQAH
jgi:hypothetical protein